MALAALKTWVAAEVLYAADLNAERDNILNNALSLISPLTGNLDVNSNDMTGIDELAFTNAAANATAAGRLRRNSADLTWHNGTSALVLLPAATQAQMETATSNVVGVTPGRQQFHPSAVKAWALWNTSAVMAVNLNVDSITDATGSWTMVFGTDFSSASYAPGALVEESTVLLGVVGGTRAAGSWNFQCRNDADAVTDPSGSISGWALGDQ